MRKESHTPTVVAKPPTAHQLARVAHIVRGSLRARSWENRYPWIEQEEIGQDAVVSALATAARGRLDPSLDPVAYLSAAARREVMVLVHRRIAVVSLAEHAAERGEGLRNIRVQASKTKIVGGRQPDERLHQHARDYLWNLLAARIRLHTRFLSVRERRAVDLVLGSDGAPVEVDEAAWRTGLTVAKVNRAIRKIAEPVREDPEAQRLRREILDTEETP